MRSSALAPHVPLVAALVVASLGLAGCSSSGSLAQAARPEPPAAAKLEPPIFSQAVEVGPEFTQALVAYHRSVVEADNLGPTERDMAIRRSLRLLADAIQTIPYQRTDLATRVAATTIRDAEARAALGVQVGQPIGPEVVRALDTATTVLAQAARGPYRDAPAVAAHARALEQAVNELRASQTLRTDRVLVVHALAEADRTLTAIYSAVAAGQAR